MSQDLKNRAFTDTVGNHAGSSATADGTESHMRYIKSTKSLQMMVIVALVFGVLYYAWGLL